ncbi:MAG: AAA family ATPase, partial [Planctomycetales bacterium]|nr:AAA family ATPase [Planctomycetales bacterium]
PFAMTQQMLFEMKEAQLIALRSDAPLGDYHYELTEFGGDRARRYVQQCTYFGAAPVPLEQYAAAVACQSLQNETVNLAGVKQAFDGLVMSSTLVQSIGESLNMGCGLFLYGEPGNGKSTLAERLSEAFPPTIWIPRAISAGGEIVRLFDSIHHVPVETSIEHDRRWIQVKRPTIAAGGELELKSFDVTTNPLTGISEAPLQLKANCGTLVVDDFGRNRFEPAELLNRLVVPLERRCDSLHLKSGRTFRIPFDCMIVFSSNLKPQDLVDEAFLRRIPYKIDVPNPTDEQFLELFAREAAAQKVQLAPDAIDQLFVEYRRSGRAMRFCHPRDLLRMVANACDFAGTPRVMTEENLLAAADRYFTR